MGRKHLTEITMEEYNEILWLFLQENALLLFLLLLLQGVCHSFQFQKQFSARLLDVISKEPVSNEV